RVRRSCRGCCRNCIGRCLCKLGIEKERGNNNLFHYNIKDRWSKIFSRKLALDVLAVKMEPEVHIKTEDGLEDGLDIYIKQEPAEDERFPSL
ncbi:unnamed protein product, partial [Darwinula stevensoni]